MGFGEGDEQLVVHAHPLATQVAGSKFDRFDPHHGVGQVGDVGCDVALVADVEDSAGVVEEHPYRGRRLRLERAGDEIADDVVQGELAAFDGVEHQQGHDRLGDAGDSKARRLGELGARDVGDAGHSTPLRVTVAQESQGTRRARRPAFFVEDRLTVEDRCRHWRGRRAGRCGRRCGGRGLNGRGWLGLFGATTRRGRDEAANQEDCVPANASRHVFIVKRR
jgi:hypothetical protein